MESEKREEKPERTIEDLVGNVLRVGVSLAATVALIGAAIYLFRHGSEKPHLAVFRGEPSQLRSVSGVLAAVSSESGRGTIQLACLLLLGTPILRVAMSFIAFARERDRTYTAITALVLAILLFSLFGSA